VCSESCVGRIRYLGVILYDADRIEEAASVTDEKELYEAQLKIFLDPSDPKVIAAARAEGIPEAWLDAAVKSPVYKMAIDWKIAFPLHPEYRTLPMVWYVPPLSPIQAAAESGQMGMNGIIPDTKSLRIPITYLANLLTGGKEKPVITALDRLLAMRAYMRGKSVEGKPNTAALDQVGLTSAQADEMYRYLAIANYEDRFVIPSTHREETINTFEEKSSCGFTFGNGCSDGVSPKTTLFGNRRNAVPVDLSQLHARKKTG